MRSDSPVVSVIMPVYNCGRYVGQAIESILAQTYVHWELLICDDDSDDDSLVIVKNYASLDKRISYYRNNYNAGAAHSRNVLLREARGTFIAMMDADDVCHPNRLAGQLAFMTERNLDGCGTNHFTIDADGRVLREHKNSTTYQQILWSAFNKFSFCNASLVIRRDCLMQIGGYDEGLKTQAEDIDMLFRVMLCKYRIETLDSFYYYYRLHDSNVSKLMREKQKENSFYATKGLLEKVIGQNCSEDFVRFVKYFHRVDFRVNGDCQHLFETLRVLVTTVEDRILDDRITDRAVRLDIARKMIFLSLNHWHKDRINAITLAYQSFRFNPLILRVLLINKWNELFHKERISSN